MKCDDMVCVNQLTDKIESVKFQRGAPGCREEEREMGLKARAEYERNMSGIWQNAI